MAGDKNGGEAEERQKYIHQDPLEVPLIITYLHKSTLKNPVRCEHVGKSKHKSLVRGRWIGPFTFPCVHVCVVKEKKAGSIQTSWLKWRQRRKMASHRNASWARVTYFSYIFFYFYTLLNLQ